MNQRCTMLIVLNLLNCLTASVLVAQSASATVGLGAEHCRTISFPGGWKVSPELKRSGYRDHFQYDNDYEFRRVGDSTHEFFVRAHAPVSIARSMPRDYSANEFRVNLSSGAVRPTDGQEWESSVVVPQSLPGKGPLPPVTNDQGVLFADKLFRRSGPQWPFALQHARISLDEKWIAVQSWAGKDYRNGNILSPRGGPGEFFIDLYEVSSGKKLVAVHGTDKGWLTGDVPLANTFWLDSRYFILHLGSRLERILVCEVTDADVKSSR